LQYEKTYVIIYLDNCTYPTVRPFSPKEATALPYSYIERNLARIRTELAEIAARTGRPAPTIVAVTKSASDEEVLALASVHHGPIAENRVPNFRARRELLSGAGYDTRVHLIGSLQTNKVKYIAADAAIIESLDSPKLAAEIERQGAKIGRKIPVLIEVNSAREAAKGGLMPEHVLPFHAALTGGDYPHLCVAGLMTMGPVCECEEDYRPYFRETRALFDEIRKRGGFEGGGYLSMGMSDSYRVAAEEGSDGVRIGRALFRRED
jgi:pyridoxal phosphate enzyme (YggS family)